MNNLFSRYKHTYWQKGTILIVALFIVALVEIVTVGILTNHRIVIHHTRNYFDGLRAMNLALAGEEWAKARLLQSFHDNDNMISDILPRSQIPGGYIEGQITDAQGKFNLNNLVDSNNLESFNNMMTNLLSNINGVDSQFISNLVKEKLSKYSLDPNTQDSVFPFNSITELRALPKMNADTYMTLVDHIGVLPNITYLNINSATKYSLLTLSPNMTPDAAEALIKIRESLKGFSSVESFMALDPLKDITVNNNITVQSQYYLSSITVHYEDIDMTLNSLLNVINTKEKLIVKVEWRSFGTL